MWLIHKATGEEGWHICQANQREPCNLLVFLKVGGSWKTELWKSEETRIRAKNNAEEVADEIRIRESGFSL